MKYLFLVILFFICSCGDNSQEIHKNAYISRMKYFAENPSIPNSTIMVGDSITENWVMDFPENWYNRGIGMDSASDVASRLITHIVLDQPSKIILLIGINGWQGWFDIVEIIKQYPEIKWYVISLLPNTWDSGKDVVNINTYIKEITNNYAIWINAYRIFIDYGNWPELFVDGLHPNQKGYELLKSILTGI